MFDLCQHVRRTTLQQGVPQLSAPWRPRADSDRKQIQQTNREHTEVSHARAQTVVRSERGRWQEGEKEGGGEGKRRGEGRGERREERGEGREEDMGEDATQRQERQQCLAGGLASLYTRAAPAPGGGSRDTHVAASLVMLPEYLIA